MKKAEKILWVKFGWSDYYRGGPVNGNFNWLNENEGQGHEAFNFMPAPNGTYYCYVPPQAKGSAPSNNSSDGWTVVCLAKNPKYWGIHVVGWYENATLIGDWKTPNPAAALAGKGNWAYCITSESAFFVPPDQRNDRFSHTSVRQSKYSFLAGPDVQTSENKQEVLRILKKKLKVLRRDAIHNPNANNAPDPETDPDPLSGFGTPEQRKRVEEAAERAVVKYYEAKGFRGERVAHLSCGYDYVFTKQKTVHHVEVKGTSLANGRFFLTRNENNKRDDRRWRLGMVTDALTNQPKVTIYDNTEFKQSFDLEPYVFVGYRIVEPKND